MKFKPLQPADYPDLKPFFRNLRYRLCPYSLPSIIAWCNVEYRPYGAIADDTFITRIEFASKPENHHLLLPVSPTREYGPEELRDLAISAGIRSYWYVPEDYIRKYGRDQIEPLFTVKEQKEYHDYVYLAEDLATLRGNKYSKKRNLINQFKRDILNGGNVEIETMTPSAKPECVDFLGRWCDERKCNIDLDVDLLCEKQALINTIENMDLMEVNGLMLRINDEVCAFGMASYLTDKMGVLYFEKALTRIKGLYQYFDNICAQRLFDGYTYINKENDMDLPGLAKSKKSYYPVMIIKSFKLELK